MRWRKLEQIYCAKQSLHPKLATHAANPLPVRLEGDLYRVFFSGRDAENRSSVGFVDVDVRRRKVERNHQGARIFEFGAEGSFYSHGVSIGNCYAVAGERYILFMGWRRPSNAHWRGEIGRLRLGRDTFSLTLADSGPFMPLDDADPVSLSYPWVLRSGDGSYRMWYGTTWSWDAGNGEMLHVIRAARSPDGRRWTKQGPAIPYEVGLAQAFSRPTVIGDSQTGYQMWFSYRGGGSPYRIGYATSEDGERIGPASKRSRHRPLRLGLGFRDDRISLCLLPQRGMSDALQWKRLRAHRLWPRGAGRRWMRGVAERKVLPLGDRAAGGVPAQPPTARHGADLRSALARSLRIDGRIWRFLAVSALSNGLGYCAYLIIVRLGAGPKLSMTFVYGVCTLLGFYGNRAWAFEHTGRAGASFIRYGLVYLAGYGMDWLILHAFVDGLGYPHQLVQAAAVCVLAAYFFLALKFFVFRHQPAAKPQFSPSP